MQALKTVVITGANKGIGFGILENLIQKQSYKVIMACRSLELAQKSRTELIEKYNLSQDRIDIIELDISSSDSIDKFIQEFTTRFHSADILINNAAVAVKTDDFNFEIVQYTFKPNFYGTVELTEKFIPLLAQNGKIITIGSQVGNTKILESDDLVKRFKNPNITREDVFKLADEFQEHVKNNTYKQNGWPSWGYGISKLLINTYVKTLASNADVKHKHLQVYTCCPGWVKTDMAAEGALLTIVEGALTPVYLVELPHEVNPAYQGQFFHLQKVQEL
ncbi:unnamed protein product (macronuclear) [Paramecium tetraurelia]|uniref:Carbonyl reductase n=1 Tax=Paramecium tetraurelia TaxID=5888 RepID=A0E1K9_PARTE|nr:uncharacterized protein GSPATT00022346001 [Paramecium tetraurelia]CAK89176.1 unnamed protein product [Paramecium tetraurelia]|eukprot:XP_001456573.1 hypothetical protein (macronuclear) [Paramecium tetraurelia strain d4-2]